MVMFRDFVQRNAQKRRLAGKVWNNTDGSVEFVAEGPQDALSELLSLVQKGPVLARVDSVEEKWTEATGEFADFRISY